MKTHSVQIQSIKIHFILKFNYFLLHKLYFVEREGYWAKTGAGTASGSSRLSKSELLAIGAGLDSEKLVG
jgi:hypothetical protein